jgi:hypothetical protein
MVSVVCALVLHLHRETQLAIYGVYTAGGFALLFLLSVIFTKTRGR